MTIYRMPAEWEPHARTWLSWPHEETDWGGKLDSVRWCYVELVRILSASEPLVILCHDQESLDNCALYLSCHGVECGGSSRVALLLQKSNRSWVRDSGPTAVFDESGRVHWIGWKFNAWAKYPEFQHDAVIKEAFLKTTNYPLIEAVRPDNGEQVVMEGGGIDTDGEGTLLTTEECFLSEDEQVRNVGLTREGYESVFKKYLGIKKTIWLGRGCAGDDTHGHVDDLARFVAPGKIVLSFEEDESDINHDSSVDNFRRLQGATDAKGRSLEIIKLPYPSARVFEDLRLPASYANFYIANSVVIVPTFNDEKDYEALSILRNCFPDKKVVGIGAVDMVLGQGTFHCSTQQEPR